MKKTYIGLLAGFFAVMLLSCATESPFNGEDNRLLSFSLTTGGKEYKGAVKNSEIIISLPVETDLNNAKVAYTLSENATILPEPEKITNWNDEQVFNVFSYNGVKRTYVIHIKRQLGQAEGTVLLATDGDVKAFAEKNITAVEGDLIIGNETGTDSISNIDALTYVTKVGYKLIINSTYKGKDLSGLRNLEETGSIIVNANKYLSDITLKNLKKVGQDLFVNSHSVKQIVLPMLETVDSKLFISSNKLTDLQLPILKRGGDIKISGSSLGILKLRELEETLNSIILQEVPSLTTLDLSKLKEIRGDLIIKGPELVGLKLNNLTRVGGNLNINNSKITSALFPSLTETGDLFIVNNNNLKNISLKNLKTVKGNLELRSIPITSVEDMANINSIDGKLITNNLPSLKDISPIFRNLTNLSELSMTFVLCEGVVDVSKTGVEQVLLDQCNNLEEIIVPEVMKELYVGGDTNAPRKKPIRISGLKEVEQKIEISNLILSEPQDWVLTGLESGSIFIKNSMNLKSFSAPDLKEAKELWIREDRNSKHWESISFAKLTKLNKLNCVQMFSLKTIECPMLQEINTLSISDWKDKNEKLTHLNGLSSLEKIEFLTLKNISNFNDYSFLKKAITNGSITKEIWNRNFSIANNGYNPTFQDLQAGHYVKQ
ncbi:MULTISPECIES: DUF5018 domain-containing protein [Proteiniphilum]|uniref:DUF5018 domain-containing protein n=1 Tax=Proteiniphilum TaxID=294702 RepID=UPI001EEAE8BA|nr:MULTISPECIES: DUF5018 domain-containing protein [Proteiniphilum]ULB33825.1 hypothetical protein KDN43_12640 [Proteiniphilum propionicum]